MEHNPYAPIEEVEENEGKSMFLLEEGELKSPKTKIGYNCFSEKNCRGKLLSVENNPKNCPDDTKSYLHRTTTSKRCVNK